MDSNTRYWLLNAIYYAHADAERDAREATARKYSKAFVDGQLRKRKARGVYRVWIENPA
jgi:hypothetical protein